MPGKLWSNHFLARRSLEEGGDSETLKASDEEEEPAPTTHDCKDGGAWSYLSRHGIGVISSEGDIECKSTQSQVQNESTRKSLNKMDLSSLEALRFLAVPSCSDMPYPYDLFIAQVDNFVDAAFLHHGRTPLLQHFLENVQRLPEDERFSSGLKMGSMCSGWGVSEIVMNALNHKITEHTKDERSLKAMWSGKSIKEVFETSRV